MDQRAWFECCCERPVARRRRGMGVAHGQAHGRARIQPSCSWMRRSPGRKTTRRPRNPPSLFLYGPPLIFYYCYYRCFFLFFLCTKLALACIAGP